MAVKYDAGTRFSTQPSPGIFLQASIDRQFDGVARCVGPGREFADDLSPGRHLNPLRAGFAGKLQVEGFFHPFLADLEPGRDQQWILAFLIFLCRRRADISQQVADRCTRRIIAGKSLTGRHARQVRQTDADRCELIIGQLFSHLHGPKSSRFVEFRPDPFNVVRRQRQQFGKAADRAVRVSDAVWDQIDAKVGPVVGQRLSVPVQYPSPAGWYQGQVDAIAFGKNVIFLVLRDADPSHPADQHGSEPCLYSPDHHCPAREGEGKGGFVNGLPL